MIKEITIYPGVDKAGCQENFTYIKMPLNMEIWGMHRRLR